MIGYCNYFSGYLRVLIKILLPRSFYDRLSEDSLRPPLTPIHDDVFFLHDRGLHSLSNLRPFPCRAPRRPAPPVPTRRHHPIHSAKLTRGRRSTTMWNGNPAATATTSDVTWKKCSAELHTEQKKPPACHAFSFPPLFSTCCPCHLIASPLLLLQDVRV